MPTNRGMGGGQGQTGEARPASAEPFGALVQHSLDLVSIYDANGCFMFASPSHLGALGYEPAELLGTPAAELLHPDERDEVGDAFARQLLVTGVREPVEHRVRHKDGSWRWVESIAADLTHDPEVGGIIVNARDVTDRRRVEMLSSDQAKILEQIARGAQLDTVLAALARMLERSSEGAHGAVAIVDEDAQALRFVVAPGLAREALQALQGLSVALGRPPGLEGDVVVAPLDADLYHPAEIEILRAHGYRTFWAHVVSDLDDGRVVGAVTLVRCDDHKPDDADRRRLALGANLAALAIERDRSQARLAHQASHDALTGLPNRGMVLDRLRRAVERPHGTMGTALLFLDIDRFKVLNDSVGHEAGDRLLVELADRLRTALRPGDLVARFGGDEFVMLCERVGGELEAYTLATRILEIVREPFTIGGNEVVVTASVGITMVEGDAPEALLRDADTAMYWAKDRGRARAELFNDDLRRRVVDRLDNERDLRRAIEQGELALHYQPIVSLEQGRLNGFESLLRWPHPMRGVLAPDDFMDIAEECGLARTIGMWVRSEACRQAAIWHAERPEWGRFFMGINLTSAELHDRELVAGIARVIETSGVDPATLVFEISERFVAEDAAIAHDILLGLKRLGVLLALDDFGTGAAALLHLKRLPVNSIKIDRAFVAGLGLDPVDDAIVDAIVDLSTRLGLCTTAEGVETASQEQRLLASGCVLAQGHRFAAAMSPEDLEAFLSRRGGRVALPTRVRD
jgi:diguanylate cyclase (GGDEF)-like protein/PAS domain S-box-containing protein